jgi:5-methyltetrahydrofolate--homocysteine methyltransferase
MLPAASVSGFYLAHPEAAYFAVGPVADDQAADFARRCPAAGRRPGIG